MARHTLEGHASMIRLVVKGAGTRLRLPAISVTFETCPVAQWKSQMVRFLKIAHEVLDRIPTRHCLDNEFIGERSPDMAIDAFDFAFMMMGPGERHQLRSVSQKVLQSPLVEMAGDAELIILFEVIGHLHGGDKTHEAEGQKSSHPLQPAHPYPRFVDRLRVI